MRKTYSNSSRSTAAVEDADYDELFADERPRARRQKSGGSQRSRFDDFESESLNFDEPNAADEPAPRDRGTSRRTSAPGRSSTRGSSSDNPTLRQWLLRTAAGRWVLGGSLLLLLAVAGAGTWLVREFLRTDQRFRVASSDQIQMDGNKQVTSDQLRSIFGEDIGRNLFFIPIRERQQQMEALPWVERASVERLLPNHIRVHISERVPVAFAQDGDRIELVDRYGALLDTPSGVGAPQYSFPVLDGMSSQVPLSVRAARMASYLAFLKELDSHGEKVSSRLSEVDLSEPEDMQVVLPEGSGAITLHLGESNWFERYRLYQAHISEWQRQYPRLAKVDLRNAPQVVLGMSAASANSAPAPAAIPGPATPVPTTAVAEPTATNPAAKFAEASAKPGAATPAPAAAKSAPSAKPGNAAAHSAAHASNTPSPSKPHTPSAAAKSVAHKPAHATKPATARTGSVKSGLVKSGSVKTATSAMQAFQSEAPRPAAQMPHARPALHVPAAAKSAQGTKAAPSTTKAAPSTTKTAPSAAKTAPNITKSVPALKKPATQGGQG